ncbi:single-stranded DNA-binding protein [Pseudomonadota bacterium]
MSLNKVQLIGNLTRDPEVKQIPGGQAVASFSIATNLSWTDQSGQKQDRPEFHNIVAWRKLAEICGQYLKKGGKIYIEGRLQTRDWEGEDGIKRYKTEIVADNMIMLDKKGAETGGPAMQADHRGLEQSAPPANAEASTEESAAEPKKEDVTIEDLPF